LIDDPEAESIAYEALYNALMNYDASKGTAISTVITVYVYNALGSYVRTLNKQRQLHVISYNNIAYNDETEEHEFVDTIPADTDIEKEYISKEIGKMSLRIFDEQYNTLTNEKHKAILKEWRDSDFCALTTDIAKHVGVSQSYVSQVINNFKHCLKKKLEDIYYD
jgi:DNA-directed RNA polymerase specialized sigma subunit